jgi:hypothetical protein
VDAVVDGSVLRAGQQAHITLTLVDVNSDRTLLAECSARSRARPGAAVMTELPGLQVNGWRPLPGRD